MAFVPCWVPDGRGGMKMETAITNNDGRVSFGPAGARYIPEVVRQLDKERREAEARSAAEKKKPYKW